MDKEELVKKIEREFIRADLNSDLVNFWDDEIYWEKIARVAVEVISKEGEMDG